MTKDHLPWSKFFWSDYDGDEALRICSLSAQAVWMRMLCVMARATPKGELRIGGKPCTVDDIAAMVGHSKETVEPLLTELKDRGVYSVTRAGVIYSRRIRRDVEKSRKARENGKMGGNPKIGNPSGNGGSVNLGDKPQVKPQRPQAIFQNQSPSELLKLPREADDDDFEQLDRSLRAIPGLGRHPVNADPVIAPIWQLARAGISVRQTIIPSVTRQTASAKKPIRSWGYFVSGIEQDARGNSAPSAVAVIVPRRTWEMRLRSARLRKAWPTDEWGPMPNAPGCTCPVDLLEPEDGKDWASRFAAA